MGPQPEPPPPPGSLEEKVLGLMLGDIGRTTNAILASMGPPVLNTTPAYRPAPWVSTQSAREVLSVLRADYGTSIYELSNHTGRSPLEVGLAVLASRAAGLVTVGTAPGDASMVRITDLGQILAGRATAPAVPGAPDAATLGQRLADAASAQVTLDEPTRVAVIKTLHDNSNQRPLARIARDARTGLFETAVVLAIFEQAGYLATGNTGRDPRVAVPIRLTPTGKAFVDMMTIAAQRMAAAKPPVDAGKPPVDIGLSGA